MSDKEINLKPSEELEDIKEKFLKVVGEEHRLIVELMLTKALCDGFLNTVKEL